MKRARHLHRLCSLTDPKHFISAWLFEPRAFLETVPKKKVPCLFDALVTTPTRPLLEHSFSLVFFYSPFEGMRQMEAMLGPMLGAFPGIGGTRRSASLGLFPTDMFSTIVSAPWVVALHCLSGFV